MSSSVGRAPARPGANGGTELPDAQNCARRLRPETAAEHQGGEAKSAMSNTLYTPPRHKGKPARVHTNDEMAPRDAQPIRIGEPRQVLGAGQRDLQGDRLDAEQQHRVEKQRHRKTDGQRHAGIVSGRQRAGEKWYISLDGSRRWRPNQSPL